VIEDKACAISFAFLAAFSLSVSTIHVQNLSELSPEQQEVFNVSKSLGEAANRRNFAAWSRQVADNVYSVTMMEFFKPRPVSWSTS
jgi:hypothetical protein